MLLAKDMLDQKQLRILTKVSVNSFGWVIENVNF